MCNSCCMIQVLENLKAHSSTLCLAMCESLLAKLTDFSDTLFIASYILNSFKTELSEELTETHRLRLIGAKVREVIKLNMKKTHTPKLHSQAFLFTTC